MMSNQKPLIDERARSRIKNDLSRSFYIEAGAGTGKTTCLVERIVSIILSGQTDISRIAAITFNESAATHLRDRVREALEEHLRSDGVSTEDSDRISSALRELDTSAIQTLHSFAARLIRQFPMESGVSPGFQVMDEVQTTKLLDEIWDEWIDVALEDIDLSKYLKILLSLDVPLGHFKSVGKSFWENFDLVKVAAFNDQPKPEPIEQSYLDSLESTFIQLMPFATNGDDDPLYKHVENILKLMTLLSDSTVKPTVNLQLLTRYSQVFGASRSLWRISNRRLGRQGDWETDHASGINACKLIKEHLHEFQEKVDGVLVQYAKHAMMPLLRDLAHVASTSAKRRKFTGAVSFHDLLVSARDLVRDYIEVRDYYRELYDYVLVDEFQDTDPIQAEIAAFLCEQVMPGTDPRDRLRDWKRITTVPGKLFAVGDPKQSIYRFRRADVSVANTVKDNLTDETLYLTQNFRSEKPVISWVNAVFGRVLEEGPSQPQYIPLDYYHEKVSPNGVPNVRFFGGEIKGPAPYIRKVESDTIPGIISRIISEKWAIPDEMASSAESGIMLRPVRLDDICILIPSRSSLPFLQAAFEDSGIPYRLESASLVYFTQETRDLINCLKAIDNPRDELALVAALKSPAFGCSDAELIAFKSRFGSFNYLDLGEKTGLVADFLTTLRKFHDRKVDLSPASLLETFVRERHLLGSSLDSFRPRERWRRYQLVIDRARVLSEDESLTLISLIDWLENQVSGGVMALDSAVPDSDENAVRIMTVHRSKGLEFPVVLLANIGGVFTPSVDQVIYDRESSQPEVRIIGKLATDGWDISSDTESTRDVEERKRLLYVAATRAQHYLLVSTCRRVGRSQVAWFLSALEDSGDEYWTEMEGSDPGEVEFERARRISPDTEQWSLADRKDWIDRRLSALIKSSLPVSIAATALADGLKEEQEYDDEPWKKGRAGTKVGRAVHAVMQSVDLKAGSDIDNIIKAQVIAEGIPQYEPRVRNLVSKALKSELVARAMKSARVWREVPVAVPTKHGRLEGFIDLLFEENGELVVVDYKTDALSGRKDIDEAVERYRLQGSVYAFALEKATGTKVKEVVFYFLEPDHAVSLPIDSNLPITVERAASEYTAAAERHVLKEVGNVLNGDI